MNADTLPLINLELFLNDRDDPLVIIECKKTANTLINYGTLLVKDPRVTEEDNSRFLDLMEDYFAQPFETKLKDVRSGVDYQMGVTPELKEEPRCHRDPNCQDIIAQIPEDSRLLPILGPDVKWDLLGILGNDLNRYRKLNTVLAGFHYDLGFMTIHVKIPVRIPDGCLLVQAGKQLEWLMGGEIKAGYHEVVVTESTLKAIEDAKKIRPERPLWKVSLTFFFHILNENLLSPLKSFIPNALYPPVLTGNQVNHELGQINLMES
ncbi:7458_t:CDS:2, partial [Acaulospora morrowiae]